MLCITLFLWLHRIQIQTLVLLIEQSETIKLLRVHFCFIKGSLQ